jgi:hypothetical protein
MSGIVEKKCCKAAPVIFAIFVCPRERSGKELNWFLLRVTLQTSVDICENVPNFVKNTKHDRHFAWRLNAFSKGPPVQVKRLSLGNVKIGHSNVFFMNNVHQFNIQHSLYLSRECFVINKGIWSHTSTTCYEKYDLRPMYVQWMLFWNSERIIKILPMS